MKVTEDSVSLDYQVHGASRSTTPSIVLHEGVEIEAPVPVLEVELTPLEREGQHGRIVLRFVGADLPQMAHVFDSTGTVEVTVRRLAAVEPEVPKEEQEAPEESTL